MSKISGFHDDGDPRPSVEHSQDEDDDISSSSLFLSDDAPPSTDNVKYPSLNEGQESPNYDQDEEELSRLIDEEEPDLRRGPRAPALGSNVRRAPGPTPRPSQSSAPPDPSKSNPHVVIPSNGFAPAYDSTILDKINRNAGNYLPHPLPTHLAHLNCFQLTHPHTVLPASVIQLKQHAQAVCLFLSLLQPTSKWDKWPMTPMDPPFPPQFDFLNDLTDPYPGSLMKSDKSKEWHKKPLPGLSNTLESGHGGIHNIERCTRAELIAYANKLLTRLDHLYSSTGGILSIPPPPPPPPETGSSGSTVTSEAHPPAHLARNSILAQWLGYSRALTLRLASLEKETAAMREVLGHEALVAGVRGKQSRERTNNGEGCGERELVFPQDRYVLAGLSEGLWIQLHDALSVREGENREEQQHEREERQQGRGVQGRGWGDFAAPEADDGGETKVVTWIETMSRLYRIRGHDTIFVIPGFGLHPGAPAVHRVERGPLVQSVPERRVVDGDFTNAGATAWERDVAAHAKDQENQIRVLESAVAQLKHELETEKTSRRRLVAEAELKGRRAAAGTAGPGDGRYEGEGQMSEVARGKQRQ